MGSVFKKTATKPMPAEAKTIVRKGQRLAEWIDRKNKRRTAPMTVGKDGSDRIVVTARTYTAKYRDGSNHVIEKATGCRDEQAARAVLAELEKRSDKVRSGIRSAAEDSVIDHQTTPLADHIAAYVDHQKAKGLNRVRVKNTESRLERMASECGFEQLADMTGHVFEKWLLAQGVAGMSAGNRNEYRQEWIGFANWCVRTRRVLTNPFSDVAKADAKVECRRKRRAMTEDELVKLLDVARRRPLIEAKTIRRGKRKGLLEANPHPNVVQRLELLGRERALIYKTLVLTGLRRGELASLTIGQLHLEGTHPYVELAAADEKNRQGSQIPIRGDLAEDLMYWVSQKRERYKYENHNPQLDDCPPAEGRAQSDGFSLASRLFNVPVGLVRILDRDLKLAGIPKRDDRGRTLDVHALRHSFGTLLSKGNVAPRTAQAAMRHSTINLTMNNYTDPRLLDVHGALDALPKLQLPVKQDAAELAARGSRQFAPKFAPTRCKPSLTQSSTVKTAADERSSPAEPRVSAIVVPVKRKSPLTWAVNGLHQVERKGVEPSTSALRTQRSPN